ncbi:MAG: nucleoside phosphorylase [Spirochaetia bacterium]|nr:nucleoside phosphorylase [Spirochaetia bacterium]
MLVGDPGRAEQVSKMLKTPRLVNSNRGLLVFTGSYKDTMVTVATTSMGAPSAAIVVEELCNLGASVFIRVGSAGGMALDISSGDLVIATAAVRDEGTSSSYIKPSFPAVCDFALTNIVLRLAKKVNSAAFSGIVLTHDAFYRGQSEEELNKLKDFGVLAREMETSCIFVVSKLRQARAATILAIGGNILRPTERSVEAFLKAETQAIMIALDSLVEATREGLLRM